MRKLTNGLLLLCICIFTALVLVKTTEPENLITILGTVNRPFIYMAVAALFCYCSLEAVMLRMMLNYGSEQCVAWSSVIRATAAGQYFNMITPFSSGGQPMQLHAMVEEGIPLKKGTAVLVNKFLVFQIGVTVYSFVLILFGLFFLHKGLPPTSRLIYFGVAINCTGLLTLVLAIYNPILLKSISGTLVQGLSALHIIKRGLHWHNVMNHKIDDYTEHIRDMIASKRLMTPVAILTILQLTAYFSIGWFVYRALGLSGSSFINILSLQALLFISVAFIPTPGSAGASEYGFFLLFSAIFTPKTIAGGVLLWRGISYYLYLCLTGLVTLGFSIKEMIKHH